MKYDGYCLLAHNRVVKNYHVFSSGQNIPVLHLDHPLICEHIQGSSKCAATVHIGGWNQLFPQLATHHFAKYVQVKIDVHKM